jgi:adenine-specific DNA-methyltransferase
MPKEIAKNKKDYSELSKDDLIKIVEKLESRKKYGLIWDEEKVKEQFEKDAVNALPVLKEVKGKEITDKNAGPVNIFIEGDNYHALSVLNFTHQGKIDVVYIDPPYNTGAKTWRYNNDYVEKDDSYRHSKWLSFMNKRLRLAYNLLPDDGFLICAIDDNEIFTLGLLLDEIFGENNRLGMVTVLHNPKGRNQAKFFSANSEFMLVYAKDISRVNFNKVAINEDVQLSFDLEDEDGKYRLESFMRARTVWSRENRPLNWYPIYVSKDLKDITSQKKSGYYEVYPITNDGKEMAWKNIKETFDQLNDGDYFTAQKDGNKVRIYHKYREQQVLKNVWLDQKYQSEFHGTNLLKRC